MRKIKAEFTREMISDLNSQFGLDISGEMEKQLVFELYKKDIVQRRKKAINKIFKNKN